MKKPNTATSNNSYNDTVYRPRKTATAMDSNYEGSAFDFEEGDQTKSPR